MVVELEKCTVVRYCCLGISSVTKIHQNYLFLIKMEMGW